VTADGLDGGKTAKAAGRIRDITEKKLQERSSPRDANEQIRKLYVADGID